MEKKKKNKMGYASGWQRETERNLSTTKKKKKKNRKKVF